MNYKYYDLKDYIQILCHPKKIKLYSLAKKIGISRPYFSMIINHKKPFLKKYYEKICEVLDLKQIDKDILIKYVEDKKTKNSFRNENFLYQKALISIMNEVGASEYEYNKIKENLDCDKITNIFLSLIKNIKLIDGKCEHEIQYKNNLVGGDGHKCRKN